MKDIKNEHHHHPIKWAKTFLFGATAGAFLGYAWFVIRPFQSLPIRKLLQASGDKPWTGRYLRWARNVIVPYMLIGGSLTLSYQLIFDYLRHHEETNNDRPLYFDHMFALTLIGATSFGFYGGMPRFWFIGGFVGGLIVSPMSWWLKKHGRLNAMGRHSNIFYENNVSQDEVDRIRHLDTVESMSSALLAKPGYGYFQKDGRHV